MVARDRDRAEQALGRLRQVGPTAAHRAHYGDLSLLADVKRIGAEIAAAEPRLDVLINNAGSMFAARKITAEGLERTFALNHMAYFVLTHCLRERLIAAAPSRIVSAASAAHRRAVLDFDNLQTAENYRPMTAYGRSKLCNILFTRELAKRGPELHANCFHPGVVRTGFAKNEAGIWKVVATLGAPFLRSPERGARSLIWLALSDDAAALTGEYIEDEEVVAPSAQARDDNLARRVWEQSAQLVGLPDAARA